MNHHCKVKSHGGQFWQEDVGVPDTMPEVLQVREFAISRKKNSKNSLKILLILKINIFFSGYVDTTSMNPQFHIQIPRSPNLSKCHVVVSVTQQYETNVAETKKRKKRKLHHIGFAVYEVPPHMTRLTPLYVAEHVNIQFLSYFSILSLI